MIIKRITRYNVHIYNSVLNLLRQLDIKIDLPAPEQMKMVIRSDGNYLFVAENDGMIVGMLTVTTYIVPTGKKAWIEDVVVDESYRGKGIGKGLILHAIDFAGTLGVKQVDLTSRPFRKEANELYKKLGFELRQTNVYRYTLK